jgi:hypothetical protein
MWIEHSTDYCDDTTPTPENHEEPTQGTLERIGANLDDKIEDVGEKISDTVDRAKELFNNFYTWYESTPIARVDTHMERILLAQQWIEYGKEYLGQKLDILDKNLSELAANIGEALQEWWVDAVEFVHNTWEKAKIVITVAWEKIMVAVDPLLYAWDQLLTFRAWVINIVHEKTGEVISTVYEEVKEAGSHIYREWLESRWRNSVPAPTRIESVTNTDKMYTVQPGDNLVTIAMNNLWIQRVSEALSYVQSRSFSDANPSITNINVVHVWQNVVLPPVS